MILHSSFLGLSLSALFLLASSPSVAAGGTVPLPSLEEISLAAAEKIATNANADTNADADADANDGAQSDRPRNLQDSMPFQPTRACGEQIGSATREQLTALMETYVTVLFPPGSPNAAFADLARGTLVDLVQFGYVAYKICGSCTDFSNVPEMVDAPYNYDEYCAEGAYGADATHSAVLLMPTDPDTGMVLDGNLRGNVHHRGSTFDLRDSVTEAFPESFQPFLEAAANDTSAVVDLVNLSSDPLTGIVAVAAGGVSIHPDHLGYGESFTVDRTFFHPDSYALSTGVTWLAAMSFIESEFGGCTVLEPVVTATGYSEGGYASIPGTIALRNMGVTINSMHVGGVPFILETQFFNTFDAISSGSLDAVGQLIIPPLVALTAYAYSNDFPFQANAGTTQTMAPPEFLVDGDISRDLRQWFATPQPLGNGFIGFLPADPNDMINDPFLNLVQLSAAANSSRPCTDFVDDQTNLLCQPVMEGELTDIIANVIDFTTVFCQSPDDTVVFPGNLPDVGTLGNPMVSMYVAPIAALAPRGDHFTARIICNLDPIGQFQPSNSPDAPLARSPLENPPASCNADPSAPVAPPVMSPVMEPSADTAATHGTALFVSAISLVAAMLM